MDSNGARPVVKESLRRLLGREPTLAEIYIVQAVARFDGGYGNFKSPPHGPEGPTSNNWGAVQDTKNFNQYVKWTGILEKDSPAARALRAKPGPPSPKPTEFFYGSDYQPGKGWFYGPYKVYPTAVDGAMHTAGILKKMGVLAVSPGSTWNDVARKMYEGKYFTGYTTNKENEIRNYATNLMAGGNVFAKLFEEVSPILPKATAGGSDTLPAPPPSPPSSPYRPSPELPTLTLGDEGEVVALLQRALRILDDGKFGPITERNVRHLQAQYRLPVTGKVDKNTWKKLP